MPQTRQFLPTPDEAVPGPPVVGQADALQAHESWTPHRHRRAQFVFAASGVMSVTTEHAVHVVPPARAVWMPAGVEHGVTARTALEMRSIYVHPSAAAGLPTVVCVLQVAPLLRELVLAAVVIGDAYTPDSAEARLMNVLLDQIGRQTVAATALPTPREPRLARIAASLVETPGDGRTLAEWGRLVGASERTLNRLFARETGMTFRQWREQCRLHRAVELLAADVAVVDIAHELGYDSTSAFIALFRRAFGVTPGRYLR